MSDYKTSLLINKQVPEFVRDEHPLFVAFLEAYYEYLENAQPGQKNDVLAKSKNLRNVSDIDASIEDFEQNFINTFAALLPNDTAVDKSFLIKNALPLYLAKGSEKSFQFLFRMLFGQELEISYPKNNVLRASDGKWVIENALVVKDEVYSTYTGDGETVEFKVLPAYNNITQQDLAICVCGRSPSGYCVGFHKLSPAEYSALASQINSSQQDFVESIEVYVNGRFKVPTIDYFYKKEYNKIMFTTAPADGDVIRVLYKDLNKQCLVGRKLTGEGSNANALVEKEFTHIVNGTSRIELYINSKTLIGGFRNGELIRTDVIADDGSLIQVEMETVSTVAKINILDGGSNYAVGDPVIFNNFGSKMPASAEISKVFKGTINKTTLYEGASGFTEASRIAAVGYEPSQLDFYIASVDTTGSNTANTFTIFSNLISDIDPANTVISSLDWRFPGNVSPLGVTNVNTVIAHAMSNVSYTNIGGISNVAITTANVVVSVVPTLNAAPASINLTGQTANTTSNSLISIDRFGSIGKIWIENGGSGYEVGDEVIFTEKPMSCGTGLAAEVSQISPGGNIRKISIVPSKIAGTVSTTSVGNVMVSGTGTNFVTDLIVGDRVMIGGETRTVASIASTTSMNLNSTLTQIVTNKPVRKYGKDLIGGQGYTQDKLPTATVSSTYGTGASLRVVGIMGDGEIIIPSGDRKPGEIQEIVITSAGDGFTYVPTVDLSQSGDGNAIIEAELTPSYETYPGRWINSDGLLSSNDKKIQGNGYLVNYSYLTTSAIEFSKYKKIFKELVHPAGYKAFAEVVHLDDNITASVSDAETIIKPTTIRTLSGRVNIANASIYVTGVNTKFEKAETMGLISVGSYITVNNEIRVVDSIISNTNLAVTSAFTITANLEEMIVMNTVYDAVLTEVTLDEIMAENEFVLTVE